MYYFWYTLKYIFFIFWSLFLNIFFYFRYYFNALIGRFNEDYTSSKNKNGFILSFEDDFDSPEIDWTKWNKWWSDGNGVEPSQTAAIPSLDCIRTENSFLYLTTKRNDDPNTSSSFPCKSGTLFSAYDSWCENGQKKSKGYQQHYGYFEIRCKPPKQGKLFWPAFWLWGNMHPPEIDIFEFMSGEDIETEHTKGISFTNHWGYQGKPNNSLLFGHMLSKNYRRFIGISVNWDEHFHVYACNWTPYYIDFYIDDIKVYRTTYNIPSNHMSIVVNNGAYVKQPPADYDLPSDFIVDYIRTYIIS